jgi:hypothetical protein
VSQSHNQQHQKEPNFLKQIWRSKTIYVSILLYNPKDKRDGALEPDHYSFPDPDPVLYTVYRKSVRAASRNLQLHVGTIWKQLVTNDKAVTIDLVLLIMRSQGWYGGHILTQSNTHRGRGSNGTEAASLLKAIFKWLIFKSLCSQTSILFTNLSGAVFKSHLSLCYALIFFYMDLGAKFNLT